MQSDSSSMAADTATDVQWHYGLPVFLVDFSPAPALHLCTRLLADARSASG
jgi:hypothetical protein